MKKILYIIVGLIVIIALVILVKVLIKQKPPLPEAEILSEEDTTAAIDKDLESLNIEELDKEFESIDTAINSL